MTTTTPIEKARNLGPKSRQWLECIGIDSLEALKAKGVVQTYLELKAIKPAVSLNLLYAMQAALLDLPIFQLPREIKSDLRQQLARDQKRERQ